jgi:hypothetical protein
VSRAGLDCGFLSTGDHSAGHQTVREMSHTRNKVAMIRGARCTIGNQIRDRASTAEKFVSHAAALTVEHANWS